MGVFSSIFGTSSVPMSDRELFFLPEKTVRLLINQRKLSTISSGEEGSIEAAILKTRNGQGKTSRERIHKELLVLREKNHISKNDMEGALLVIDGYIKEQSSESETAA